MRNTSLYIFNKINQVLNEKEIPKKKVALHLGISNTALSNQFKRLRSGKGINTKTLEAIEERTGFNFFSF